MEGYVIQVGADSFWARLDDVDVEFPASDKAQVGRYVTVDLDTGVLTFSEEVWTQDEIDRAHREGAELFRKIQ